MIAKVIPAKARSRSFSQLLNYVADGNRLRRPHGREFDEVVRYNGLENRVDLLTGEKAGKVIAIETQGVRSLRTAAVEMEAVAARCHRLRAAAQYHVVVSWQEFERPNPDQAFAAGRHALAAIGMQSHQYVMAIHGDTANVHLHVAVNRVHPETYRAVSPFRDYIKLDAAMREVELKQRWAQDRGPTISTARGVVVVFKDQTHADALDQPARISTRARDFVAWRGDQSFTEWVRQAAPAFRDTLARDGVALEDLQRTASDFGLQLRIKGSGLSVVHHEDATLIAKASQIARFLSRENVESRIGPLAGRVPAWEPLGRGVAPTASRGRESEAYGRAVDRPTEEREGRLSVIAAGGLARRDASARRTIGLERDYKRKTERRGNSSEDRSHLDADFQEIRRRGDAHRRRRKDQRKSEQLRYAAIADRKAAFRRELEEVGLASQFAISLSAFRAAQERADLRKAIRGERVGFEREAPIEHRQVWREWLMARVKAGDPAAIDELSALRNRNRPYARDEDARVCGLRGDGETEPRVRRDLHDLVATVERNGDIAYHWKANSSEAFRDRGQEISFTDIIEESIVAGLDLARKKWGNTVTIVGPEDFKMRALRLVIERGMLVRNDDLQIPQQELVSERAARQLVSSGPSLTRTKDRVGEIEKRYEKPVRAPLPAGVRKQGQEYTGIILEITNAGESAFLYVDCGRVIGKFQITQQQARRLEAGARVGVILDSNERANVSVLEGRAASKGNLDQRLIDEQGQAGQPVRHEILRIVKSDFHETPTGELAVSRWDVDARTWLPFELISPIGGAVEFGRVHVVGIFPDGRREVDEEKTKQLRIGMAKEATRLADRGTILAPQETRRYKRSA